MKSFLYIFVFGVLNLICTIDEAFAKSFSCETIGSHTYYYGGDVIECKAGNAVIDSLGFSINAERNESITGLKFRDAKKVLYLPEKIFATFPNLIVYNAYMCSVKEINYFNFKNLKDLKYLELRGNSLEKVNSGTFDDLTSLEYLGLNYNKIKYLNSEVFRALSNLNTVWLLNNICINEDFFGAARIVTMKNEVSKTCGWCEETSCIILSEQGKKIQDLLNVTKQNQAQDNGIIKNKIDLLSTNFQKTTSEATKKAEDIELKITALIEEQKRQNKLVEQLFSQLQNTTNVNVELRLQLTQAEALISRKIEENGQLHENLKNAQSQIAEKNEAIKRKDEKIKIYETS